MKYLKGIIIFLIITTFMCGCQVNPDEHVVKSKNDGTFDASILQQASEPEDGTNTKVCMHVSDEFSSVDGSVVFSFQIDQEIDQTPMPVVEVIPHYLTAEDVQRVAYALFGSADYYEREPVYAAEYSKSQLQEKIRFWSRYANQDAMEELYGAEVDWSNDVNLVKQYIQKFTEMQEKASDTNPHTICDWIFKKESSYFEINTTHNDIICSTVNVDNLQYSFTAVTRDSKDFKLNGFTAVLGEGIYIPTLENQIYEAMLCRTAEPTQDQIAAAKRKAQEILDRMALGDWSVVNVYVETEKLGENIEYTIRVDAVPVLQDIPIVQGQMIHDLTSGNAYASNYYISSAYFQFAANGELVFFGMDSPIDVKAVINENVTTMPLDKLVEIAKTHLSLYDAKAEIGVPAGFVDLYEDNYKEELVCRVKVTELVYGLGRVKAKDTEDSYYYLPVVTLKGVADYYGKDTGNHYMSSSDFGSEIRSLVWINAVDGTIVEG